MVTEEHTDETEQTTPNNLEEQQSGSNQTSADGMRSILILAMKIK